MNIKKNLSIVLKDKKKLLLKKISFSRADKKIIFR